MTTSKRGMPFTCNLWVTPGILSPKNSATLNDADFNSGAEISWHLQRLVAHQQVESVKVFFFIFLNTHTQNSLVVIKSLAV